MPKQLDIEYGGEWLTLLGDKAVLWRRAATVFVSDMHIGKAAAFCANGVPAPQETTAADLERLLKVINETEAQRLVILGDLLHSADGCGQATMDVVMNWLRQLQGVEVLVVRGNHDRNAERFLEQLEKECCEPLSPLTTPDSPLTTRLVVVDPPHQLGPFCLVHDPAECRGGDAAALAGHLHPCVRLRGGYAGGMRSPCFWVINGGGSAGRAGGCLVLPAFGRFTGSMVVSPGRRDRVFVVGDGVVVEVGRERSSGVLEAL